MIGITNLDQSFFTVESPDINLETRDFSKNLISLNITERMSGMPQGTLSFYDPDHVYSRILRTGARLGVSWGYKAFQETPESLFIKKNNADEITGSLVRRGLEGFISSPTGTGSNGGVITYNCNFTAYGFRGELGTKTYNSGNKAGVIAQAFDEMGISAANRYIDFTRGEEQVTTAKSVRQDQSTFRFLTRVAREWRALFSIGFNQQGQSVGIFIDPDKVVDGTFASLALGAVGSSHLIGYRGQVSNVKSYTWSTGESESGIGDNAQVDIVDGQIIFRRYSAQAEKVVSYKLKPERIQQVFKNATDIGQQTRLLNEMLSAKDFEEIKHFFDPIEATTAPDGYGYRIKAQMIGNPLFIPPNIVKLNNGFPDRFGDKEGRPDTNFYLHEVSHAIDRSGYSMNVDIVDAFTINPIGGGLL